MFCRYFFKQRFTLIKYLLKKEQYEFEKDIDFTCCIFAYKYYVHRLLRL